MLPETGYQGALEIARKLRDCTAQTAFRVGNKSFHVTASFGLCGLDQVPPGVRGLADRMLKVADATLYRSKANGRNRVTATALKDAVTRSASHGFPLKDTP